MSPKANQLVLCDWLDRQQSALPAIWVAALRERETVPLPALAAPVIELLERLKADAEVQLAALLHLSPELRALNTAERAKAAPGLELLLDGLRAAEQVWSLHAQRENRSSAEGLRRLLLAIIRDLRVVLILLAEHLARMRAAGKAPGGPTPGAAASAAFHGALWVTAPLAPAACIQRGAT